MNGIAALAVGGVSLLLNIVSLAIPYWLYNSTYTSVEVITNLGLWKICINVVEECASIPDYMVVDSLKATRAMEILGMLLLTGALVCAVIKLFVMKSHTMLPKIAAGWAVTAGIFMFIGCIIFAVKFDKEYTDGFSLHYGFVLCIVAGIGSIKAGVLFFMIRAKKKDRGKTTIKMNRPFAFMIGCVSLLMNFVGVATPYWLHASMSFFSAEWTSNIGLWEVCSADSCESIPDFAVIDSLRATRIMEILGMLLLMGALVCVGLPKIAAGLAVAAGTSMLTGCLIFAATYANNFLTRLDAGFTLCIVAGVRSIVSGVLISA